MISFLQKLIGKHHKILFSVLLFIIIVAFVFTIGATPGIGYKNKKESMFYGFNLASPKDINNLIFATQLTAEVEKQLLQSPAQVEHALLVRIISLDIADKAKIPSPTDDQLKRYIENLPAFKDEDEFSKSRYNNMINALESAGKNQQEIRKIFNENFRISYVLQTIGGKGLAFNKQVYDALIGMKTLWTFQVAKYSIADFNDTINVTDEECQKFFDSQQNRYISPIQYKVSCIVIPASYYTASIERPSKDQLNDFYTKNQEKFAKIEGKENIQKSIVSSYYNEKALEIALGNAEKFIINASTNNLTIDKKEAIDSIANIGGSITNIAPYSVVSLPNIQGIDSEIFEKVQSIDSEDHYSDPIVLDNKVVILYLDDVISGGQMSFSEAKHLVIEDVKSVKKQQMFAQNGEKIKNTIIDELNKKSDFEQLAISYGFSVENFNDVSLEKNNSEIPVAYFGIIDSMKGKTVQTIFNGDTIFYFHIQSQKIPNISEFSEKEVAEMRTEISETIADLYRNSFFDELILKGITNLKTK